VGEAFPPGPGEAPVLNIVGESVALGPMRRDLIPTYQRWVNDFGTLRTLFITPGPMTLEQETVWYDASAVPGEVGFTIYERATWRPIGNCGLHRVNQRDRTAEFGIMIGEKDCWGRGFGRDALGALLDYAFRHRNAHKVWLEVSADNERAIRAYRACGFVEEGRLREQQWADGRYKDVITMGALRAERAGRNATS
jgi:RimJ/RimL family protein N-acetyltransferase